MTERQNVPTPRRLVRYEFGGTVGVAAEVLGPAGGDGVTLEVPDLPLNAYPVSWSIWNTHATQNLMVRGGPTTTGFVPAAAAVLDNYVTFLPGAGVEEPLKPVYQMSDAGREGNIKLRVLQVLGSGAGTTFSGYCTAWVPE